MVHLALAHISWSLPDNAVRPACDAFLMDVFGAQSVHEMLITPETEKYRFDREERLVVIGDTMLIPIAPAGPGAEAGNPLGDMLRKSAGPNRWIGLALRTTDLQAAAAWFTARGFTLHQDPGMEEVYFLIPKWQAFGVRIEVLQVALPDDPREADDWSPRRWRDDHPLGIEGLLSVDVAVPDEQAARSVFAGQFALPELGSRRLPGEALSGAAFLMGDTVLECLSVDSESDGDETARFVRDGKGICGMTFKVRSAAAAAEHLRARGFTLIGDPATRFAIDPAEAQGRLLWFADQVPAGWPAPHSQLTRTEPFPAI